MSDEPITLTLSSMMVTWKSLGLTDKDLSSLRASKDRAMKVIYPLEDWLKDNAKNDWRMDADGVWFVNDRDAVLFKLFWASELRQFL